MDTIYLHDDDDHWKRANLTLVNVNGKQKDQPSPLSPNNSHRILANDSTKFIVSEVLTKHYINIMSSIEWFNASMRMTKRIEQLS